MKENFSLVIVGTGGQGVIRASTVIGLAVLEQDRENKIRTAETHGMAQRGGSVIVHLQFGPSVESPLVGIGQADVLLSFELAETIRYIDYLKDGGILIANREIIIPPVLFRRQKVKVNSERCIGCGNCKINCRVNYYYQFSKSLAVINYPASKILNGICNILDGCTGCKACIATCSQNAIEPVNELSYPLYSEIEQLINQKTSNSYIINASKIAENLGDIRMTNIVMIGALLGTNSIPLSIEYVKNAIKMVFPPKVVDLNLKALENGFGLIKKGYKNKD